MTEIAKTANANPKPSSQDLVKFFVEKVLPSCNATAGIAKTPEEQQRLQQAIAKIQSGNALPRYDAANKAYADAEKTGKFKTPVIGGLRRAWAKTKIFNAFLSDAYHTWDGSGMNKWQTVKATTKLLWAFLPYSEAVSAFLFGRDDARTKTFSKVLNTTGWLRSHKPFSWVSGWLPVRGTNNIDSRFISPTDLAWAKLNHYDYNVKPGTSLDQGR
jgi:hypothetical protein